jgi:FKBP-type peptidyl-prolyl cis-trans isomerase 2
MDNKFEMVRIEYTGTADGEVFDSTSGEVGKRLYGKEGPISVLLGFDGLVPGLEDFIRTMKKGDEAQVVLTPDKAFGAKNEKFISRMSVKSFAESEVTPYPGAMIEMDTGNGPLRGRVMSAENGRVVVDFNHPLAGRTVTYNVKLIEIIESAEEKIPALAEKAGLECTGAKVAGGKATITLKGADETKKKFFTGLMKIVLPEVADVEIVEAAATPDAGAKKE